METIVVGLVLAAVGVAYVLLVVGKLGVVGKLRKRRRAHRYWRNRARQH